MTADGPSYIFIMQHSLLSDPFYSGKQFNYRYGLFDGYRVLIIEMKLDPTTMIQRTVLLH